jgi:hypothetical protein
MKEEVRLWVIKALEDLRIMAHEMRLPSEEVITVCREVAEGLSGIPGYCLWENAQSGIFACLLSTGG